MSLIKLKYCLNFSLNQLIKRSYTNTSFTSTSSSLTRTQPTTSCLNSVIASFNSNNHQKPEYKCPSSLTFKIRDLNDIKIRDISINKHEFKLPQLNNQIELIDPLLHIEKSLPQINENMNVTYQCGQPLFSVLRYRSRRMNKLKQKRYFKKMKFVLMKREIRKQRRYEKLLAMYKKMFDKRTQMFDPQRLVHRELEKAKFWGYRVNPIYNQYRDFIKANMNTIDERYTRKFDLESNNYEYVNFSNTKRGHHGRKLKFGFRLFKDNEQGKKQKEIFERKIQVKTKRFDPIAEAIKNK